MTSRWFVLLLLFLLTSLILAAQPGNPSITQTMPVNAGIVTPRLRLIIDNDFGGDPIVYFRESTAWLFVIGVQFRD